MSTPAAYVAAGGVLGLTWAAALRSWMVELAGTQSSFSWWTVSLVLAPGVAVGAVAGFATWCRRAERPVPRWASRSVALLATAVLDPEVMRALVANGQGSGALLVAGAGYAGGAALSRTGWSLRRGAAFATWGAGIALVTAIGTLAGAPGSPRGVLVCGTGGALVALLGAGAALGHRDGLVVGRLGARVLASTAVATWAASVVLLLTRASAWSGLVDGPLPRAVWTVALGGGLLGSALMSLRWRQALLT